MLLASCVWTTNGQYSLEYGCFLSNKYNIIIQQSYITVKTEDHGSDVTTVL